MKTAEFNYLLPKFKEALAILKIQDPKAAEDLSRNTKINIQKRRIKYTGFNKDLAGCFLPPSCIANQKDYD